MLATPRPPTLHRLITATMVVMATVWLLALSSPAAAHPLGNFTVNTYAGLRVAPDVVAVDFVVDLAEIATTEARAFADDDRDGQVTEGEWADYGLAGCTRWAGEMTLVEQDMVLGLQVADVFHQVQPGEGGAPTLRVECAMDAARPRSGAPGRVVFTDTTFPDRQGWREVTAVGDRTTLVASSVPTASTSDRLAAYPGAGLEDPIDVRTAELLVEPGGASASTTNANGRGAEAATILGAGAWADALDRMVSAPLLGEGLAAVAVFAAIALGVLHALAPGHGKTVIAAYLVGQRGSLRHAAALALSVALTHTAGVLVLGAGLWTASVAAPERLYPLLGVASGIIITAIGVSLLRRSRGPHNHAQHSAHHEHAGVPHGADTPAGPLRARTVVALGFAGGLVPTPSALLVLLGALSVGRLGLGVLLVVCYGVGMALALVTVGLALSHARGRLDRRLQRVGSARLHALSHALPRVTASIVTLAGVVVIARSAL